MDLGPGCEIPRSRCCRLWTASVPLRACQNTQVTCCIKKYKAVREQTSVDEQGESESIECVFEIFEITAASHSNAVCCCLTFRSYQKSILECFENNISPLVFMFLHRSTSQSNLPCYHNSHSVPQPRLCTPTPAPPAK